MTERPRTTTSRLDALVNIALLVASVLVAMAMIKVLVFPPTGDPRMIPEEFAVGDTAGDELRAVTAGKTTLVIFVSTSCHYCASEMPMYREWLSRAVGRRPRIVLAAYESAEVLLAYAQSHKMVPDATVQLDAAKIRLAMTPTLILVDGSGYVEGFWRGALRNGRAKVEEALFR